MKFPVQKTGENILGIARKVGYIQQRRNDPSEIVFVRPIQRDFPRFHLYVKEMAGEFLFNLHLDQKKPSYGEETAHSGEYDGEVVESEAQRIMGVLAKVVAEPAHQQSVKEDKQSKLTTLFRNIFRK